ncbi:MAG: hypothetical protein OHK0022_10820 [Roseiflexaceae bacterium]
MEYVGTIADVIGIVGAVFAGLAWLASRRTETWLHREQERLAAPVFVCLVSGSDRKVLPLELTRAELSRAELLGRIGMVPMKTPGARFSLASLSTPVFLRQLREAQQGNGSVTIELPCTQAEIEQFDL